MLGLMMLGGKFTCRAKRIAPRACHGAGEHRRHIRAGKRLDQLADLRRFEAGQRETSHIPFATEASTGIPATPARGTPWLTHPGTPKAHVMFVPTM